jgi:hypothetical protein
MKPALLLALCACVTAPVWPVSGGTPEQRIEAQAILDRARALLPVPGEGFIEIVDYSMDGWCGAPGLTVAGCTWVNGVTVRAAPGQSMATSALGHELAHYATDCDDVEAEAWAKKIQGEP